MSDFVYREPLLIVADVIQSEMDLDDGQVMATNNKFEIPTKGLFVAVSYIGPGKPIANCNDTEDDGVGGLIEVQSLAMRHLIQIDIMSFGSEARTRKEEIAMALFSLFSQGMQEKYAMSIARMPGVIMDTSYLEGAQILTRYTTTIVTSSVNKKRKAVASYNSFSAELNTDPVTAGQPIEAPPQAV